MNFCLRRGSLLAPVGTALIILGVASANAADAPIPYAGPPPQYGQAPYAPPPPVPYAPPPPVPYAPPPLLPCLWLGPYVGTNVGFQWTSNMGTMGTIGNTGGVSPSGFTGGIQGGYNWQTGPWVYGVESDFNLSSSSGTFADYQFSNPWFGTVRGRAGYVINNNIFFYGTAGLAVGLSTVARGGLSDSSLHMGWTIGTGVEFGLAPLGLSPNWSAKVEYLHLGLSQGTALPASVSSNFPSNVVRFGVNYHF
jgi:outer membrane immunogenic protein